MAGQVGKALDKGTVAENQQSEHQTEHVVGLQVFFVDVVLRLGLLGQVVQGTVIIEQLGDQTRVDDAPSS